MVDDAVQALEAQTAYFVGKGQVHQFVQANQINGYVVRFTDDYLHDFSPSLDGSFESILFRKVNSVRFIKLDKKETDNLDKCTRLTGTFLDLVHHHQLASREAVAALDGVDQ